MADLSDVLNGYTQQIQTALYPNGVENGSLVDRPVMIYSGWPIPATLEADIKAGKVHVSVFPWGRDQNVTRHTHEWEEVSRTEESVTIGKNIRQQKQVIQIAVWAARPEIRDEVAKAIDAHLADKDWFKLSDDSDCRNIYLSTVYLDDLQKAGYYRRDLMYSAEFAMFKYQTTDVITSATVEATAVEML